LLYARREEDPMSAAQKIPSSELPSPEAPLGKQKRISPELGPLGAQALHFFYLVLPFVMGMDKFLAELVSWHHYLPVDFPAALGLAPNVFLFGAGCIEMGLAMIIGLWPRAGADLLAIWLISAVTGALIYGEHYELACVAAALAAGAFGLARISWSRRSALRLVQP
jgi:hypothetical protein